MVGLNYSLEKKGEGGKLTIVTLEKAMHEIIPFLEKYWFKDEWKGVWRVWVWPTEPLSSRVIRFQNDVLKDPVG